jgi:hypothetical protein
VSIVSWRGLGEDLVTGEVLERIWFLERSLDLDLDLGEYCSLERSWRGFGFWRGSGEDLVSGEVSRSRSR